MNDLPNLQIAVSPLSSTILAGYSAPIKGKPGLMRWRKKQDVTQQAVNAVLQHLLGDERGMEWEFGNGEEKIILTIKRRPVRKPAQSKRRRA